MSVKHLKRIHYRINVIIALVLGILFLFSGIVACNAGNAIYDEVNSVGQEIDSHMDGHEIEDVEGYGLIISGIGYVLGGLASWAILLIGAALIVEAVLLLVPTLISAILGCARFDKVLGYAIARTFVHLNYCMMTVYNVYLCIEEPSVMIVLMTAFWAVLLIYGVLTTYTPLAFKDNN